MDIQNEIVAEFDREVATTRKMLNAIPEQHDGGFKAHPKSFSFGRLVGHVAELPCDWALKTLTLDKLEFGAGNKYEPYIPASKSALLERFDKEAAETRAALVTMTPEKWDQNWKMVGSNGQVWVNDSRYNVFRTWVLNHLIHHRALLGLNLRLQNLPIPGSYGPSADEMPGT